MDILLGHRDQVVHKLLVGIQLVPGDNHNNLLATRRYLPEDDPKLLVDILRDQRLADNHKDLLGIRPDHRDQLVPEAIHLDLQEDDLVDIPLVHKDQVAQEGNHKDLPAFLQDHNKLPMDNDQVDQVDPVGVILVDSHPFPSPDPANPANRPENIYRLANETATEVPHP